jgi:hypothetical protein
VNNSKELQWTDPAERGQKGRSIDRAWAPRPSPVSLSSPSIGLLQLSLPTTHCSGRVPHASPYVSLNVFFQVPGVSAIDARFFFVIAGW